MMSRPRRYFGEKFGVMIQMRRRRMVQMMIGIFFPKVIGMTFRIERTMTFALLISAKLVDITYR